MQFKVEIDASEYADYIRRAERCRLASVKMRKIVRAARKLCEVYSTEDDREAIENLIAIYEDLERDHVQPWISEMKYWKSIERMAESRGIVGTGLNAFCLRAVLIALMKLNPPHDPDPTAYWRVCDFDIAFLYKDGVERSGSSPQGDRSAAHALGLFG